MHTFMFQIYCSKGVYEVQAGGRNEQEAKEALKSDIGHGYYPDITTPYRVVCVSCLTRFGGVLVTGDLEMEGMA